MSEEILDLLENFADQAYKAEEEECQHRLTSFYHPVLQTHDRRALWLAGQDN